MIRLGGHRRVCRGFLGHQLLAHPVQEQMTHLRKIQMAMDRLPAAHLEVVEPQFILFFAEGLLDGPARISHVQQPFQRNTRRSIGYEELQFAVLWIPRDHQPVRSRRQSVALHEEPHRLDLADDRPLLAVLDMNRRPPLTSKRGRMIQ